VQHDVTDLVSVEQWAAHIPGLVRTEPQRWELPDNSIVSFPESGHAALAEIEERSYWFNHRNAVIAAGARHFPPPGPIFDIGGGNGYVSVGLRNAGFDCVVVEPGPHGAANAAARGFPVICAPFQNLSIAGNTLPAAGLFDVLEHIEDDEAALANLHRVLKPGGRLYIAVPAHRILWSEEDIFAGHFRRYSLRILREQVEKAGFTVEYGTYFFAALLAPIFLLRALPARLGLGRTHGNEKAMRDHVLSGGIGRLIHASFASELATVSAGKTLRFGASCFLIARK
jgi:SAM-dependent methyltransferase